MLRPDVATYLVAVTPFFLVLFSLLTMSEVQRQISFLLRQQKKLAAEQRSQKKTIKKQGSMLSHIAKYLDERAQDTRPVATVAVAAN